MISLDRKLLLGLAALFVIWGCFVVSSGLGWNPFGRTWDFSNPGAFGDSFGPLSALMASVAALSAIATYRAQSEELDRIRQRESERDRAEAKASFENTFFRLLDHHRQNLASIDLDGSGAQRIGQDAFRSMVYMFRNGSASGWSASWSRTFDKYQNDLGHYFRFLYHIVRYVHHSDAEDKYFYIQILRATLSESELILIGANCAYGEGVGRFQDLVETYALLHNISPEAKAKYKLDEKLALGAFERRNDITE